MASYRKLLGPLESLVELHKIPYVGTLSETRENEEVKQELQAFLEPIKQAIAKDDIGVTKETITQYGVDSVRLYTKLVTLSNQIKERIPHWYQMH